jgi:hypothetical protein
MISTSLTALAVAGALATGSIPAQQPVWQSSYRTALGQAVGQQKPLAVFIGHGAAGVNRLVADGGLGADAVQLLKANYISLYIDADTASGKGLAEAFKMTEGLVISDKTGGTMALRHEGTLSQTALTGYLQQYQGGQPVAQTQYVYSVAYQPAVNPGPFPNRPVLNAITSPVVNGLGAVRGAVYGGG